MKFILKSGNISIISKEDASKLRAQGYYVHGKYNFIDPLEALFLIKEKNVKIFDGNNELGPEDIINRFKIDEKKFEAYRDLKLRGYNFSIKDSNIILKNGDIFPFLVFSPSDIAEFPSEKGFLAIVDDDLDLTYFIFQSEDPYGKATYYKETNFKDTDKKYLFEDLIKRKFKLNSGLKFGTEFIAYESDEDEHSKYMVKILRPGMQWIEIAGLARVAHGVRKKLLLARMHSRIEYFSIFWFRA